MSKLVAGVDCSTQSTKVVVVDAATGEVAASGRSEHIVSGTGGARETDPEIWWTALRDALTATGLAGEVHAIAVAGQQHGLVCLDGRGRALRSSILWNDTRSAADAADLVTAYGGPGDWASRIGVVPVASFTASKWAWLRRNEPAVAARTRAIRLPHDYLTEKLCGAAVTDRGDASGTAWWSTAAEAYSSEVLALPALQLSAELLPQVLGPREPAGEVTAAASRILGVPQGVVVGPGTGDNMASALGLGVGPGTPVVSLGTSGTVFAVSETRPVDPSGLVAGFADATGRYLPLACTLNCTLAVDRMASWLSLDREDVAPSDGVVVLPWFDGERTPNVPDAAAAFFGMRHATDPRSILMAGYEGAIAGILDALSLIDSCSSGIASDAPLVLVGGGARGKAWREVAQRLSGRPISVPDNTDLVAIGAAVQAASILLGEPAAETAARWRTDRGVIMEAVLPDTRTMDRFRSTRRLALEAVQSQ